MYYNGMGLICTLHACVTNTAMIAYKPNTCTWLKFVRNYNSTHTPYEYDQLIQRYAYLHAWRYAEIRMHVWYKHHFLLHHEYFSRLGAQFSYPSHMKQAVLWLLYQYYSWLWVYSWLLLVSDLCLLSSVNELQLNGNGCDFTQYSIW